MTLGALAIPISITLKAVRRLADANLVLYGALVGKDVLKLAPQARRLFVGKRAGRKSVDQETIHRLMVRAARRGLRVVRLKGGDPFVLGRGGEEALALAKVGVPFDVIPGVSSAIAAPVLSGIPLTHRGLSSGFVVVAEHAEESFRPVLEPLAPNSLTVVGSGATTNDDRINCSSRVVGAPRHRPPSPSQGRRTRPSRG